MWGQERPGQCAHVSNGYSHRNKRLVALNEMAEVFGMSNTGHLERRSLLGTLSKCKPLNYCVHIVDLYVCYLLENYFQQIDELVELHFKNSKNTPKETV